MHRVFSTLTLLLSTNIYMKVGVVVFPGSNCDRDMQHSLQHDLNVQVEMLWHKEDSLNHFSVKTDYIILPGGFSYGDYLRCGAIARFSPMMKAVIAFANNGGKVIGICNGFQILCESGLLPGALLKNKHQQFICKNIFLTSQTNQVLTIPIAHGEGRYYADANTINTLEKNNQVIYRYCTKDGELTDESNVNGSINHIAGIKNEFGNVFGMMPHPERATSTILGNKDGMEVFKLFGLMN